MLRNLLFIIGFFVVNFPAFSQVDCSCASGDSLKKSACGPVPPGLKRPLMSQNCSTEDYFGTRSIAGIEAQLQNNFSRAKTKEEFLDYLSCYRNSDQQFCHYKLTLAPYIEYSSKTSGLPFAVEACLYLQESEFSSNSISSPKNPKKAAHGYSQINLDAVNAINDIIQPQAIQKYSYQRDSAQALMNVLAIKANLNPTEVIELAEAKAEYFLAKSKLNARAAWDNYWKGSTKVPSKINLKDTTCPSITFAMGATEQVFEANLLRGQFELKAGVALNEFRTMDHVDAAIFVTGAYNAGVGGFRKVCKQAQSLEECIEKLKAGGNLETYKHLVSIRNCAYHGFENRNFEPKSPDNCKSKKCRI